MFCEFGFGTVGYSRTAAMAKRWEVCLPFGPWQANLGLYSIRKSGLIP
ncbi:hypothetical protein [Donghicola tyrosinivorans]|nr:hypothetical protein [Donghicola tyrosinivorans]